MQSDETVRRKRAIDAVALCPPARFDQLYEALSVDMPSAETLRGPEIGSVMLRGRIGGAGAPFNLGEASVTRASVRLADGAVGHSMLLGRHGERSTRAAHVDALWQTHAYRDAVEARLIEPAIAARRALALDERAQAEATRVDFFTMVRGDDE
ncbi:phosphonate C-P lyase system protein PhnG [Aureimonas altamirensis]|uniref:phosphonate C-P lyase system protein PhnG n=1 Tax=Aureimonas altamirensis TaxID=370622 RepID=UPI0020375961|nr:phosphonate C-P lyase system protein PhnG [Aureimonas altamirensis]MCM2504381.1 phosphonate C-P lyase system protein PhnG [Aureimonas altamirensis]